MARSKGLQNCRITLDALDEFDRLLVAFRGELRAATIELLSSSHPQSVVTTELMRRAARIASEKILAATASVAVTAIPNGQTIQVA